MIRAAAYRSLFARRSTLNRKCLVSPSRSSSLVVQQVEQQRGEARVLQDASDILISRTVAAAPTSMREEHDAEQIVGDDQLSLQSYLVGGNLDVPRLSATILRGVSTLFVFLPVVYLSHDEFPS